VTPVVVSVSPAARVGLTLLLIVGVGALPAEHARWGLGALPLLFVVARLARVPLRPALGRFGLALPFLLTAASAAALRPDGARHAVAVLTKSTVSVLALQLLVATTPLPELLRVLRRVRVPEVLCNTIALLHRYSYVLSDEVERMRRARAGRTLRRSRWGQWRVFGNAIGLSFVRSLARAERVQTAMRARGGG